VSAGDKHCQDPFIAKTTHKRFLTPFPTVTPFPTADLDNVIASTDVQIACVAVSL
jgi:hypothetical protein